MKRLIKKAYHDIMNRDCAIIMVGNNFYEDVTHAACLKQFLDIVGVEEEQDSFQSRPDLEMFNWISEEWNVDVVLAHKSSKEDSIYLIYQIVKGGKDFLNDIDIGESIRNKFEKYYGLETKNESEHDGGYTINNPYADEAADKADELFNRMLELNGHEDVIPNLKDNGFKIHNEGFYYNNGITISFLPNEDQYNMYIFGDGGYGCYIDDIENDLDEYLIGTTLEKILTFNPSFDYIHADDICCDFTNPAGIKFELMDCDGDIFVSDVIYDGVKNAKKSVLEMVSDYLTIEELDLLWNLTPEDLINS